MRAAVLLRRQAPRLAAAAALGLLGLLAATVPSASGAFSSEITNSTDTAATATYFRCLDAVGADKAAALFQWPLSDAANSTSALDISGKAHPGTYQGSVVSDATRPIACPRDGGSSWRLNGSTSAAYYSVAQTDPTVFTMEIAFQTSVPAGKLFGFGSAATGPSPQSDRHVYIDTNGSVVFGVGSRAITSPLNSADGRWHALAASLSSTNGMRLYLDGDLVASDPTATAGDVYTGYWRIGYDSIGAGWPNAPANGYFTGRLRGAALYTSELTPAQLRNHAVAATAG